jgi:hypothetical protein
LSAQNWLPLTEYSNKYRVSLSTLRRKIKSGELENRFIDGKYFIKDGPVKAASPGLENIAPPSSVKSQVQSEGSENDSHWRATQDLLGELKRAYSLILQEKEEQILQLKEEVADLKMLVRVLEQDNERLKKVSAPDIANFDLGLEA